jgi:metal-dependent amidase/aminoacylase/carboxypeptidase family protein
MSEIWNEFPNIDIHVCYLITYVYVNVHVGCFFFVGAGLPGERRPHHKSVFDFDERAMLVAASVLVQLTRDILQV